MSVAVPAPGGSVTLPRFTIMALGAGVGVFVYAHYVSQLIPDQLENWSVGPMNGAFFWYGVFALLGGAASSMMFSHLSK